MPTRSGGPTILGPIQALERHEDHHPIAVYHAGDGGALAATAGFSFKAPRTQPRRPTRPTAGRLEVGVVPDVAVGQGFQDHHRDGSTAQGKDPEFPRLLFLGQAEGYVARREPLTNAPCILDHVKVDPTAGQSEQSQG